MQQTKRTEERKCARVNPYTRDKSEKTRCPEAKTTNTEPGKPAKEEKKQGERDT